VAQLSSLGIVTLFEMGTRYKIVFRDIHDKPFAYLVFTFLDERKAIAMATGIHIRRHPDILIYKIGSVEKLDGTEAQSTDIVDRQEY
jgi:hypothetical protein